MLINHVNEKLVYQIDCYKLHCVNMHFLNRSDHHLARVNHHHHHYDYPGAFDSLS